MLVDASQHLDAIPMLLHPRGTDEDGAHGPARHTVELDLGLEGADLTTEGVAARLHVEDPERRARAIVEATTHFADPARVAAASTGLGTAMQSVETSKLEAEQLLSPRGW